MDKTTWIPVLSLVFRLRERKKMTCLRMRDHSLKNLGIHLHLEIASEISTYMSDIFLYHQKIQPFAS